MVQTAVTISGDKLVQILTKFCNWRKKFVDHSDNYCLLFSVSYMQYSIIRTKHFDLYRAIAVIHTMEEFINFYYISPKSSKF